MATETPVNKPLPVADQLTEPFWRAIDRCVLEIQRCQKCDVYNHPPVTVCSGCGSTELQFYPVTGRGRVKSFTVTHDARQPAFENIQPYIIAAVELDEQPGLYMLSNIPETNPDDVRIGMIVALTFEEISDGRFIPQFVAAED